MQERWPKEAAKFAQLEAVELLIRQIEHQVLVKGGANLGELGWAGLFKRDTLNNRAEST